MSFIIQIDMVKLKCIKTECKTKLFTAGKVYHGFDYNDHIDQLQTIKDDLGYARHISINNERIHFVIGHSSNDNPYYAIFELINNYTFT